MTEIVKCALFISAYTANGKCPSGSLVRYLWIIFEKKILANYYYWGNKGKKDLSTENETNYKSLDLAGKEYIYNTFHG